MAVALLLLSATASAQLTIPGTNVTYRLNNEDWRYLRTFELPEGGDIYLYCYTGHVLRDQEGDTVLPFLRIYVNKHYRGDLYELVYDRYEKPVMVVENGLGAYDKLAMACPPREVLVTLGPTPILLTRRTTSST